jgi:hypothetical protein
MKDESVEMVHDLLAAIERIQYDWRLQSFRTVYTDPVFSTLATSPHLQLCSKRIVSPNHCERWLSGTLINDKIDSSSIGDVFEPSFGSRSYQTDI